jgi:hypothetical protein
MVWAAAYEIIKAINKVAFSSSFLANPHSGDGRRTPSSADYSGIGFAVFGWCVIWLDEASRGVGRYPDLDARIGQ